VPPRLGHKSLRLSTLFAAALLALALLVVSGASPAAAACARTTIEPQGALVAGQPIAVAGTGCGPTAILANADGSWRLLAKARPNAAGRFAKTVRVHVKKGTKAIGVKAVSRGGGVSQRVRVPVERTKGTGKGKPAAEAGGSTGAGSGSGSGVGISSNGSPGSGSGAGVGSGSGSGSGGTTKPKPAPIPVPTPVPAPEPAPEAGGCALTATSTVSALSMTAPACGEVASDTGTSSSPLPFWGSIQCASESRYSYFTSGGDPEPTAYGSSQGNEDFRRLTVFDGDEFSGERCELGLNSTRGPTAFYREGEHRVTYYSERLPSNFPLSANSWQTVMQMKQAQPSHDNGGGVALEMEARQGKWVASALWHEIASFPARANTWTRFAWDVYYSRDPSQGWVQISADLNGDGDFDDPGERSPVIHTATMATEIAGYPGDGIAAGAGIPSHLRLGIYHDPAIACPAPSGCSIDVDNVQVLAP
jgi:hypothetical protein